MHPDRVYPEFKGWPDFLASLQERGCPLVQQGNLFSDCGSKINKNIVIGLSGAYGGADCRFDLRIYQPTLI
jgi:hypothetical protein